ncbi:MAG: GDP-mannose 4,6-dehydratase [Bryobacteraceae bacterium]|jgi:UDP-glucuronate 4-epimerase
MPKTLITGGAGFIGSHLCEALLAQGDQVVIVDNFDAFYPAELKHRNLRAARQSPGLRLHHVDIRNAGALNSVFEAERPSSVVHIAARAGVRDSLSNPGIYLDVNVNGTLNVLEAMRKNQIRRLVFASSSSVYGGVRETPYQESQLIVPISPYAASKVAGEALCSAYAEAWGFNVVCCRFFTVYGPRQRPDMAIAKFARLMEAGQPIKVFGDGTTARDYTFVADIVGGITKALSLNCKYEVINLGSMAPIPLSRVIQALSSSLEITPAINYLPVPPGEPLVTLASTAKANRLLGWEPKTEFESGIHQYIAWHKSNRSNAVAA